MTTEHDLTTALEAYITEIVDQKVDHKLGTELLADNIKDLDNFVDNRIDDLDITDVTGFDTAVESAVEKEAEAQLADLEVEADNVSGLDKEIESVLDNWGFSPDHKLMDTVQQKAQECLETHINDVVTEALTKIPINVDSVSNFEEQANILIQKAIKEYQQQFLQKFSPLYWLRRAGSSVKGFFYRLYDNVVSWPNE